MMAWGLFVVINLEQEAPNSDLGPRKRHLQGEGGLGAALEGNHERPFMLPLCFIEVGYFDRFPLSVYRRTLKILRRWIQMPT